jgi:hypothetical protein
MSCATLLGGVSLDEVDWPSHSPSPCHLRQSGLRLQQPERHLHRLVHRDGRRERSAAQLPLTHLGIEGAEAK